MNSQNAIFRLMKLEQEVATANENILELKALMKDMMVMLAPAFQNTVNDNISRDLIQASSQGKIDEVGYILFYLIHFIKFIARQEGVANALNPDFLGERDIPKVLDEVVKHFIPTSKKMFPSPMLRLLGLINYLKKEKGITGLLIDDELNKHDYSILKTVARKVHDDMANDLYKQLKSDGKPLVLPRWTEVPLDLKTKYGFMLERAALDHGFMLSRCTNSWAALLLLFETHKHRSNRSRNYASVFGTSLEANGDSFIRHVYKMNIIYFY